MFDYLAPDALFVIEDPSAVVRAIHGELERGLAGEAARRGTPHFPARALYLNQDELEAKLAGRSLLALHRTAIAAPSSASVLENLEGAPPDAPSLALADLSDLSRAVKSASFRARQARRARTAPGPSARLHRSRARGRDLRAHRDQAERLSACSPHRGVKIDVWKAGDPVLREERVRIVTAPLTRGVLAPAAASC